MDPTPFRFLLVKDFWKALRSFEYTNICFLKYLSITPLMVYNFTKTKYETGSVTVFILVLIPLTIHVKMRERKLCVTPFTTLEHRPEM